MRPERFMEHVNNHQIALNRFSDSLPPNLRLSVANVDAHLHRPDRASFTMLHTWFCQTHIELYSFSLQALKETTPDSLSWDFFLRSQDQFTFRCQQQAVSYAICLAQTWDYCHSNIKKGGSTAIGKGLVTVDWMVGACAVDVIDVLLVARKHKLYENLRGNTSAQMVSFLHIGRQFHASENRAVPAVSRAKDSNRPSPLVLCWLSLGCY
jgi:hypothetical protein